MRKYSIFFFLSPIIFLFFESCKKDKPTDNPRLRFVFEFDSTLQRLNNFGMPTGVAAGNAAQTPAFHVLSAHYIEMAPGALTPLGQGAILYHAPEVLVNGEQAIDFDKCRPVSHGQEFFSILLRQVPAGTYEWLRVSLAYQNYDIKFKLKNPLDTTTTLTAVGTVASFIGFNTYITSYKIKTQTITVNGARKQGYWGFETTVMGFTATATGQAPPGATTVPNPLFATSPIPPGSCVVTGAFPEPLIITGKENHDIIVKVRVSINKSFEWKEVNPDGWYQPDIGEVPVDMGVRGIYPIVVH
ncbi:MAG: hypothetical protein N2110_06835 [Flavobacteriales bacterium]|nr:hypothetical protein [Flavobacteriales bacterium]